MRYYHPLFLLLLLLPSLLFSQGYIGLSKSQVRRHITRQAAAADTIQTILTGSDSSIQYSFRDKRYKPVDFIYLFDEKGRCSAEIVNASCDTCFDKYFQRALDRPELAWQKIKDNLYVSSYSKRMMLEIPAGSEPYSFIIRKMKWNRSAYNALLASR